MYTPMSLHVKIFGNKACLETLKDNNNNRRFPKTRSIQNCLGGLNPLKINLNLNKGAPWVLRSAIFLSFWSTESFLNDIDLTTVFLIDEFLIKKSDDHIFAYFQKLFQLVPVSSTVPSAM